jgi:hypothetical protein
MMASFVSDATAVISTKITVKEGLTTIESGKIGGFVRQVFGRSVASLVALWAGSEVIA